MSLVRVLAVVSSGLAMLQAQSPQQPTFRTRIDLIQVNVVAVDEAGRHVYGLTAEDFTLLDRGKRQTIATFQEIDTRRSPGQTSMRLPATVRRDVSSNQTADQDRLVILVIDDLHVYRRRTDRAKAGHGCLGDRIHPGLARLRSIVEH